MENLEGPVARPPSNSQRVRARLALVQPSIDRATAAFWGHPRVDELYVALLVELVPLMRAGVNLMELAAATARARAGEDPVCGPLADYLERHTVEERGHHEWALEDLARLGVAPEDVLRKLPTPRMAALLGPQYLWVLEAHPVAFLGYVALIEGRPPKLAELDHLVSASGIPADALTMYRKHALVDPYHKADLDRLLDRLPLTESHHALIGVSAIHTANQLRSVFESFVRGA